MDNAQAFKDKFVDYEYCVCSNAFPGKVKVVKALPGNYLHLVGVNTSISADAFFKKCLMGTLTENDFDFSKRGVGKNVLKGAVRDKIRVLPNMVSIFFDTSIKVQPNFNKNQITCAFATSDSACTLGFAQSGHPKSLLNGDYLDANNTYDVDGIFRRRTGTTEFYDKLWVVDSKISEYGDELRRYLSEELYQKMFA